MKRFTIDGYSYILYNNYASSSKIANGLSVILADGSTFCVQIERENGERVLQLSDGDICIILSGTKYRFFTLPGTETRIATLELATVPTVLDHDSEELKKLLLCQRDYLVFSGSQETKALMLLLQQLHEGQHKKQITWQSVNYLTAALFCKIAEEAFGKNAALLCTHTRNAISYISKNYKNTITLSKLCSAIGIGERRMQKLFREELSTTFGDYLTGFRINKACDLLREGNTPIEAIAFLVGYNSRQNFSHCFKQKIGQSPQQFRTSLKKRNYRYKRKDISSLQYAFISFEGAITD